MVQWVRLRLPMQGTEVQPLVWGVPTCLGGAKPACHNYRARVPQLLKPEHLWATPSEPARLEPALPTRQVPAERMFLAENRSPLDTSLGTPREPPPPDSALPEGLSTRKKSPRFYNWRKLACSSEDPVQPKIKLKTRQNI